MSTRLCVVMVATFLSLPGLAQEWELGAAGGYGAYVNPSIVTSSGSIEPGFAPKGVIGVVFGQNMYEHIGGEVRYLFQWGGPQLQSQGVHASAMGHTNLITYDVLFHTSNREANLRPYFAAGAGIKVFTGSQLRAVGQPLVSGALLVPATQVEPVISAGAGLKYKVHKHVIIRLDFRTYFSPLPDEIFRPTGDSRIRGWVYNFVPLAGISSVF